MNDFNSVPTTCGSGDEKVRLLVIEDDEADYLHLIGLLNRAKGKKFYEVKWEKSFSDAKDVLSQSSDFDVCLLDYRLGGGNGVEILTAAGGIDAKIPVIMLTGAGNEEIDSLAMDAGAADYFDKQEVSANALERAIRYAIRNHKQRRSLRTLAEEDALTGLDNPRMFKSKIGDALKRARRNRARVCLLFLDLDGFKAVNDTHGHLAGDELLRQVSERLQRVMRESDLLARISGGVGRVGGDEFAVLLEGVDSKEDVDTVGRKIVFNLGQRPFPVGDVNVNIGVSIGAAFYPSDAMDAHTLMATADRAMYAAKARLGSRLVYWESTLDED